MKSKTKTHNSCKPDNLTMSRRTETGKTAKTVGNSNQGSPARQINQREFDKLFIKHIADHVEESTLEDQLVPEITDRYRRLPRSRRLEMELFDAALATGTHPARAVDRHPRRGKNDQARQGSTALRL